MVGGRRRAVGAYIFQGAFTTGVVRHFDVAAHLEGGDYGVETARLNYPDLPIAYPEAAWPGTIDAVLRDGPVDWVYANPPCFTVDTRVMTEDGPIRIGELVRKKSTSLVASVTEDGERVLRPIIGWHKNPYKGDFYDVSFANWRVGARYVGARARATANHRFMTMRGWVPAAELTADDLVCTGRLAPNAKQREVLDGMLLGDAGIAKWQSQFRVSQVCHEYVDLKRHALADFVSKYWHETEAHPSGNGYDGAPQSAFYLRTEGWVNRERGRWYNDDKKVVPRDLRLTPIMLAVWYMDDGTLRGVNDEPGRYPGRRNGGYGGTAHLCTDSFTPAEVDFLIERLNDDLGIRARRAGKIGRSAKYPRILIPADTFKRFVDVIGQYVTHAMRYKLPAWAPAFNPDAWSFGAPILDWDRVIVKRVPRKSTRTSVYCIDVEGTHNFVTYGGVVHNCAIFSPMGIVTTRGADSWKTDPRAQCWRNAFALLDTVKPRAIAIESVPQAYTRGREMIDDLTRQALLRGYSVTHLYEDAKWMGIPQSRKRFFFVAHRPPTLAPHGLNWAPPPTIGDALAGLDDPGYYTVHSRKDWPLLMRETPPGERLANTWERLNPGFADVLNAQGKVKGRPSFQDRRLDRNEVMGAWVGDKFTHPDGERMVGVEEGKAICGYPPGFKIAQKDMRQWGSLLARAVMPPVGAWLASLIDRTLGMPDATSMTELRVTHLDLRDPASADKPVDLTREYINERGKVIFRVRAESNAVAASAPGGVNPTTEQSAPAYPVLATPRQPAPATLPGPQAADDDWFYGEREIADGDEREHGGARDGGDPQVRPGGQDRADDPRADGDPGQPIVPGHGGVTRSAAEGRRVPSGTERAEGGGPAAAVGGETEPGGGAGAVRPEPQTAVGSGAGVRGDGADARGGASPKTRVAAPGIVADDSPPRPGEPSGKFLQRALLAGVRTPDQLVDAVLAAYPGRKTKVSDVHYNWRLLYDSGHYPELKPFNGRPVKPRGPTPAERAAKTIAAAVAEGLLPGNPMPAATGPIEPDSRATAPTEQTAGAMGAPVVVPIAAYRGLDAGGPVALVEWHPRVCGSVAWAQHLASGWPGAKMWSFSKLGRPLGGWSGPWEWNVGRIADAPSILNDFDGVVLVDAACFAPDVTTLGKGDDERPYYVDVVRDLRRPYTAMFHGGVYPTRHDGALDAVFSGPGFTGTVITTRLAQARARLGRWPNLRFIHNPYLPYDASWAANVDKTSPRAAAVAMTARLATNKGQNALLLIADDVAGDSRLYGYNAFGFPSIGYRLFELGLALGYREDGPPVLRNDKTALTHPNAHRHYTGAFAFTTPSGRRYEYRDGFDRLEDLAWREKVHLSLPSIAFGDTLEYVTLDAIATGCLPIVPATTVREAHYPVPFTVVPYEGCTIWADVDKGDTPEPGDVKGKDFDRAALAATINDLLALPHSRAVDIALAYRVGVLPLHDPRRVVASVAAALAPHATPSSGPVEYSTATAFTGMRAPDFGSAP